MSYVRVSLVALLAATVAGRAFASTSPAVAAPPAAAAAVVALQGTVMERHSAWEGGLIVTRTRLRVDRMIRGTAPAELEVQELGGRVGDIAQVAYGQPTMPALPNVAVELAPVGKTWRLAAVLEERLSSEASSPDPSTDLLQAGHSYVRTTNKDSKPPCDGPQRNVFWPIADIHYVLDSACAPGVPVDACEAAVLTSFQTWTDLECSYLSFTYDGRIDDVPIGFGQTGSNVNAVKWIETDWPGQPDAIAITLGSIGCNSGHIVDADILVNATRASFSTDDLPPPESADIQNTITHEAGHAAGFAHSPDPLSTMFVTANPGETLKRDLTADDAMGLCDVYPVGHEPGRDPGCGCVSVRGPAPPTIGSLGVVALLALQRRRRRSS